MCGFDPSVAGSSPAARTIWTPPARLATSCNLVCAGRDTRGALDEPVDGSGLGLLSPEDAVRFRGGSRASPDRSDQRFLIAESRCDSCATHNNFIVINSYLRVKTRPDPPKVGELAQYQPEVPTTTRVSYTS